MPAQSGSSYASYLWYEARLNCAFKDHVKLRVACHGYDLSSGADCISQTYADCDSTFFAPCSRLPFWRKLKLFVELGRARQ